MTHSRLVSLSLMLLVFTACTDITHVQRDYIADRDECRSRAESRLGVYSHPDTYPMTDKDKNNALLALFSECMKEHDWKVATPKKDKDPVVAAAAPLKPPAPYAPPDGFALVPVDTVILETPRQKAAMAAAYQNGAVPGAGQPMAANPNNPNNPNNVSPAAGKPNNAQTNPNNPNGTPQAAVYAPQAQQQAAPPVAPAAPARPAAPAPAPVAAAAPQAPAAPAAPARPAAPVAPAAPSAATASANTTMPSGTYANGLSPGGVNNSHIIYPPAVNPHESYSMQNTAHNGVNGTTSNALDANGDPVPKPIVHHPKPKPKPKPKPTTTTPGTTQPKGITTVPAASNNAASGNIPSQNVTTGNVTTGSAPAGNVNAPAIPPAPAVAGDTQLQNILTKP